MESGLVKAKQCYTSLVEDEQITSIRLCVLKGSHFRGKISEFTNNPDTRQILARLLAFRVYRFVAVGKQEPVRSFYNSRTLIYCVGNHCSLVTHLVTSVTEIWAAKMQKV